MPRFNGSAGPVYYREWPVSAPRATSVFVHGVGEHSGLYERFAAAMNSSGISLLALDQIGHGHTAGPRGVMTSIDELESDLSRLTDIAVAADSRTPVFVIGHSLGGIVTALSAGRRPRRYAGVVLSGATLSAPAGFEEHDGPASVGTEFDLDAADLSADPDYLSWLASDPLVFTEGSAMTASLRRILPPAWTELGETLPGLAVPVLFVHGEADSVSPVAGAREWAARLGQATLITFPGARHDVLNEVDHEAVAAAIAGFVLSTAAGLAPDSLT